MTFEKKLFEQKGLVLDKERVLTYSKLSCPLECRYCFVDDLSDSNQQKGVAYLSSEQMDLMKNLPDEVRLVMLGCDTEFFQNRSEALRILNSISELKKDISVITKLALPEKYLDALVSVAEKLRQNGNTFTFSMSIPCLDSSTIWESKVPTPQRRMSVLKKSFDRGLNTLVAVRPLLPTISDDEMIKLVESTKDSTKGYYSGPLYLKHLDQTLIPNDIRATLSIEEVQPDWMPEGNFFYKLERPGQMETLRQIIERSGRMMFDGAAEANNYLRTHEEHRN